MVDQPSPLVSPPHGSVLYAENGVTVADSFSYNTEVLELIVIDSHHHLIDLQIIVVYKSPGTSYYTFSNIFEKVLFQKKSPVIITSMPRIQEIK